MAAPRFSWHLPRMKLWPPRGPHPHLEDHWCKKFDFVKRDILSFEPQPWSEVVQPRVRFTTSSVSAGPLVRGHLPIYNCDKELWIGFRLSTLADFIIWVLLAHICKFHCCFGVFNTPFSLTPGIFSIFIALFYRKLLDKWCINILKANDAVKIFQNKVLQ